MQQQMIVLAYIGSQCTNFGAAETMCSFFCILLIESYMWPCAILCANLGKCATETFAMIRQAFREESTSCTWVFEGHAQFSAGRISTEDDQHIGRPISSTTPSNIAKLQQIIHSFHSYIYIYIYIYIYSIDPFWLNNATACEQVKNINT
jgi:hypothetical protein